MKGDNVRVRNKVTLAVQTRHGLDEITVLAQERCERRLKGTPNCAE